MLAQRTDPKVVSRELASPKPYIPTRSVLGPAGLSRWKSRLTAQGLVLYNDGQHHRSSVVAVRCLRRSSRVFRKLSQGKVERVHTH